MENKVIKIHEDNLALFNEKLADLNKKFAKKGLPQISCSMEKTEAYTIDEYTNKKYSYFLYTATLSSDFNQTNLSGIDVEFEGIVSLIEKSENDKIYTFKNINYSHLLKNCKCDECGKKISRNKYLVFSKVGKEVTSREDLIVLGTSCLKNYFPFSIESYFGYLESAFEELENYDEYCGSFGGCASHYHTLRAIFNATLATTDNLKCYEKEGVTKSNVLGWMDNDKINKYDRYRDVYPMPQNPIAFEDAMSWIDETFNKDELRNDFEMNARTTFYKTLDDGTREFRDRIPNKLLGIAIYGFISAKRNHDRLIEKKIAEEKRAVENAKVEYYGNVGDKFECVLTFDKTFGFEGAYGFTYIHLFHDDKNHVFKWSSACGNLGKNFDWAEYEVGQKYLMKGTIKAHDEYKGVKQTVITRCKVLDNFNKNEPKEDVVAKVVDYVDPFETLMETMESVEQSA